MGNLIDELDSVQIKVLTRQVCLQLSVVYVGRVNLVLAFQLPAPATAHAVLIITTTSTGDSECM